MPAESGFSFDLVDEPWLPVVDVDGDPGEVSLRAALCEASEISDLCPDTATLYPSLLRLLLAVVHAAMDGPRSEREWRRLWRDGPDAGQISKYLDEHRHRFDLFDETGPFMQVADLRKGNGETDTASLLIPYAASGNNVPLFSAYRDASPPVLTPAEAARWLVHVHAWDTAGIKTGAVGDPRADRGKVYGNPVGPLGQLGVLIPVGATLWQTLMLNLAILTDDVSDTNDRPAWERDPATCEWRERQPLGLKDLYTWQARRVRLIPERMSEGVRVRRVLVAAGDRMSFDNLLKLEPHTAWRRRSRTDATFVPQTHRADRQIWRGLGSMLARATLGEQSSWSRAPRVLEEIGARVDFTELDELPLRIRATGLTYGNKNAVIDEAYVDELPLPLAVLRIDSLVWHDIVVDAVEKADMGARLVGELAARIEQAGGCRDDRILDGIRGTTRAHVYQALDTRYRLWLGDDVQRASVGHPADPDGAQLVFGAWVDTVREVITPIADMLVASASPLARRGRSVTLSDNRTIHLTAFEADRRFRADVAARLPRIVPPDSGTEAA